MVTKANHSNVSMNLKIRIVRNMTLESYLLSQPSQVVQRRQTVATETAQPSKVVQRRQTVAAGTAPPLSGTARKNIPIGARGRKRKTVNLLFIGMRPNPNGCILSQPQQTTQNGDVTVANGRSTDPTSSSMSPSPQFATPPSPPSATTSRQTTPRTPTSRPSAPPLRSYGRPSTPFKQLTFSPSPPSNVSPAMTNKDDTTLMFDEMLCSSPSFGSLRYAASTSSSSSSSSSSSPMNDEDLD